MHTLQYTWCSRYLQLFVHQEDGKVWVSGPRKTGNTRIKACSTRMKHAAQELSTQHKNEACSTRIKHAAQEWSMQHKNEACSTRMKHAAQEWSTQHKNEAWCSTRIKAGSTTRKAGSTRKEWQENDLGRGHASALVLSPTRQTVYELTTLAEVCSHCGLVLCFVMGWLLQFVNST